LSHGPNPCQAKQILKPWSDAISD
jgi:hypothetical protein